MATTQQVHTAQQLYTAPDTPFWNNDTTQQDFLSRYQFFFIQAPRSEGARRAVESLIKTALDSFGAQCNWREAYANDPYWNPDALEIFVAAEPHPTFTRYASHPHEHWMTDSQKGFCFYLPITRIQGKGFASFFYTFFWSTLNVAEPFSTTQWSQKELSSGFLWSRRDNTWREKRISAQNCLHKKAAVVLNAYGGDGNWLPEINMFPREPPLQYLNMQLEIMALSRSKQGTQQQNTSPFAGHPQAVAQFSAPPPPPSQPHVPQSQSQHQGSTYAPQSPDLSRAAFNQLSSVNPPQRTGPYSSYQPAPPPSAAGGRVPTGNQTQTTPNPVGAKPPLQSSAPPPPQSTSQAPPTSGHIPRWDPRHPLNQVPSAVPSSTTSRIPPGAQPQAHIPPWDPRHPKNQVPSAVPSSTTSRIPPGAQPQAHIPPWDPRHPSNQVPSTAPSSSTSRVPPEAQAPQPQAHIPPWDPRHPKNQGKRTPALMQQPPARTPAWAAAAQTSTPQSSSDRIPSLDATPSSTS